LIRIPVPNPQNLNLAGSLSAVSLTCLSLPLAYIKLTAAIMTTPPPPARQFSANGDTTHTRRDSFGAVTLGRLLLVPHYRILYSNIFAVASPADGNSDVYEDSIISSISGASESSVSRSITPTPSAAHVQSWDHMQSWDSMPGMVTPPVSSPVMDLKAESRLSLKRSNSFGTNACLVISRRADAPVVLSNRVVWDRLTTEGNKSYVTTL
jgi:hypothetical protein